MSGPQARRGTVDPDAAGEDAQALAGAVLLEEARRHEQEEARATHGRATLLAAATSTTSPYPGLGAGGTAAFALLAALALADHVLGAAFGVVAPDVGLTSGRGPAAIVALAAFGGLLVFLGGHLLAAVVGRLRSGRARRRIARPEEVGCLAEGVEAALDDAPVATGVALARLQEVRTFTYLLIAVGALGFVATAVPIYLNTVLHDQLGLDAARRALVCVLSATGTFVGALVVRSDADRFGRARPERSLRMLGGAVAAVGVGIGLQAWSPNVVAFTVIGALGQALLAAAFTPVLPIVAAVVPHRLHPLGLAVIGLQLTFVGGLAGAVLLATVAGTHGPRAAIALVAPTVSLVAAALVLHGARFATEDVVAAAEDLVEDREERARLAAGDELPVLQVHNVDFAYGQVQVLFGVSIEVHPGEVLALLGTNGAGKSTLLRVISGLELPRRGVVRLDGRTVTFAEPATRVRMGIVQVSGGRCVFPSLTVADNLIAGAYSILGDHDLAAERLEHVLGLFPSLVARMDQPAGTLSGGEQQMLGLASGLLLDPRVLLIDELSLGLAPIVVQELLGVVERLKDRGLSIVVVEQSVNVALSIADRAVFMEKGQVRFQGPAQDLMARDDLVRAVFLGGTEA